MTAPWPHGQALATGQVFEFRLWAALVEQSRGQLHIFLPLSDRGIDALVHRLSDDHYFRVQAKCRTSLRYGEVQLEVPAFALVDDEALLVGGLVVEGGLGPTLLVVPVREFKRLAAKDSQDGRLVYEMYFPMQPSSDSRWVPYLTPLENLSATFGVPVAAEPPLEGELMEPQPLVRSDLGFAGESEVVQLLSEDADLNLFRPFPDLETVELAALHRRSRRVLGLQIKTISMESAHAIEDVHILASSFRPSPSTYFVVVAWLRDQDCFHSECLLMPSVDLLTIAAPGLSKGYLRFYWHPGARQQKRLDPYRRQRSDLRSCIEAILLGS